MRWFYFTAAVVLIGYAGMVGVLYVAQRRLLYHPNTRRPSLGPLAAQGVQETTLCAEDGLELVAWYMPPPSGAPVIIYFHGNGGDIGLRGERMRRFAEAGCGALMVEYRGYAGNPGAPTEAGLLADARAALAFLDAQHVEPNRRVLYGESLGSGVAVLIAASRPVGALILEAPYTSIADVAQYHFPWVPVRWLMHDRFDASAVIGRVKAPMLFLHAEHDTVVPAQFGRALYAVAPEPKEAWSTNKGGHNDIGRLGGLDIAIDFVRRRCGSRTTDQPVAGQAV